MKPMKLTTLLNQMEDAQYADFTKEELVFLFAELNKGRGALSTECYQGFLEHGPEPLRGLFLKEAHELSRSEVARLIGLWHGKYALLEFGVSAREPMTITTDTVLGVWDSLVSNGEFIYPRAHIALAHCLKCERESSLPMIHMWQEPPDRSVWRMFDVNDRETAIAIQDLRREGIGGQGPDIFRTVSALCRSCYRPCLCGAVLGQRVGSEELRLNLYEVVCITCGGNSIAKLPLPKPSPTDLKLYRGKLLTLRTGVKL